MENWDKKIAQALDGMKTRTETCLKILEDIEAECSLMSYIILARELKDTNLPTE